jgi:hypothetical protein
MIFFFFFFLMLGMELRALHLPGRHSTTEPHPKAVFLIQVPWIPYWFSFLSAALSFADKSVQVLCT